MSSERDFEAQRRIILHAQMPAHSRYARLARERQIQADLMAIHGGVTDDFWQDAALVERQLQALDAAAAKDPEAIQGRYEALADDSDFGSSSFVGQEQPEDIAAVAKHYRSAFSKDDE